MLKRDIDWHYRPKSFCMEIPQNREKLLQALIFRSNSANLCCFSPRRPTNILRLKSYEWICHSCMRPLTDPDKSIMCAHLYFFSHRSKALSSQASSLHHQYNC